MRLPMPAAMSLLLLWPALATPLFAQLPRTTHHRDPESGTMPTAEQLDKARGGLVRTVAERLLRNRGVEPQHLSSEILALAFGTRDRATRYLLWRQAIECEVERGNPWAALQHSHALAQDFGKAPSTSGVALLKRMAAGTLDQRQAASIALAAMHAAGSHTLDADPRAMLSYYDVAIRTALQSEHEPIYSHVRDQLPRLRAPLAIATDLAKTLHDSPWPAETVAIGLLHGNLYTLEPFDLGDLVGLFDDQLFAPGNGLERDREAKSLTADELIALSERAQHPLMREGLLRCARNRLINGYLNANEATRREFCRKITELASTLCKADGLSRLRFPHTGKLDQLAIKNGKWRVEDGLLVGKADGTNNFATHRVEFSAASVVVIRGGIRSKQGLNFRCQAGDVNLLLNWEVEPQNHLWQNGTCHRASPPALTAGEEHTITIFSDGSSAHVCVDNQHMWTVKSYLAGTVSVYPAIGSEIFVREILIDGTPSKLVNEATGVLM